MAAALFCTGAVSAGIALILAVRRRLYPEAPTTALILAVLCLAFATPLVLLVEGPQFYQVAISCAVFLQALMLGAAYRSLHSLNRHAWLAASGLLFGLSVAARPNHLAGFAALLVIAYAGMKPKAGASSASRRREFIRLASFALAPAAVCGVAMLAYNWLRFGSVFEFGVRYQLAGASIASVALFQIDNLLPHLVDYLFKPGTWLSYFPFFASDSVTGFGLVRYLPWTWLAVAAFWLLGKCDSKGDADRKAIVRSVAIACLANLALLCCFLITNSRYAADFANAGLILAGMGALALGQKAAASRYKALVCSGLLAAAAVSLFNNLAAFTDRLSGKDEFLGLARAANWPGYAWQRAHGAQFGGLHLELRLPEHHPDNPEPLFETGRQPDQRDWLQIEYVGDDRACLGLYHAGTGAFDSREFPIPTDRRVTLEVRGGPVIPPFGYPVFGGWSRAEYDAERRDLRISVNGTEVMRAELESYESTPASFSLGQLKWPQGGMEPSFSGEILGVARLPLTRPESGEFSLKDATTFELTFMLPAARTRGAEPVVVTGSGRKSDLLYCVYDGSNRIKFALDHFGTGGPQSEYVAFDPLVSHSATIWLGSLAGSLQTGEAAAYARRLCLTFDGRVLINAEQDFYPGSPGSTLFGINPFGSTAAERRFGGLISGVRQTALGSLPPPRATSAYGAVEMVVDFPLAAMGSAEPLVVTGKPGAGDFIYVKYVDQNHVALGFDHWSIGGLLGDPIDVDYGDSHRISITMASLYPSGDASHLSRTVRVLVDGRTALECTAQCYPSASGEIKIGKNEIGGSTCGPAFTGSIVLVERFPEPRD